MKNLPNSPRQCLECKKQIQGRQDKKFCDTYCRSAYHYKTAKKEEGRFYQNIQVQLRKNRRILKKLLSEGWTILSLKKLEKLGFDSTLFTHHWEGQKGKQYFFVFDFGYYVENGAKEPTVLMIKWHDYMQRTSVSKLMK